jgi:predicted acylesterase/phospholipase RssA
MATALVLSGGGAKGSFEVGALQYLYENGFLANIICACSVGSVNGVQLAHGGTAATQAAAFETLRTIWQTELIYNEDMYEQAAWLAGLTPRTREAIERLFSGAIDLAPLLSQMVFFPPYAIAQAIALGADLIEALEGFTRASSVFTLRPTRQKIDRNLSAATVAASGVELRLVVVSLDSGAIRYVTQDGRVIETDNRPVAGADPNVCRTERAAYNTAVNARNGASRALSRADRMDRPEALREYREASAAAARAQDALEVCMAANAAPANRLRVPLADGVIASSAIPCVFPPVMLGDEAYVDGGVRWILPLQAAVDMDAEFVVAVNASPAGVPPARRRYQGAHILDIAERSVLDILLWEIQERHIEAVRAQAVQRRQKVWIVTPRVDVHDTLTIDPGLIDINIAYGYMCAADVTTTFEFTPPAGLSPLSPAGAVATVADGAARPRRDAGALARTRSASQFVERPADQAQATLADAIARCRRRCWELEHEVFGMRMGGAPFAPRSEISRVPDPDALDRLRELKVLLGLMVEARRLTGGRLPADSTSWADIWERHRWVPSDVPGVGNTPWSNFISVAGNRPAATRATALVAKAPDRPEVYLISPLRQWIPTPDILNAIVLGGPVSEVPAEFLDAIPRGADVVV